jgi:DNA-binding phage protein
MSKKLDTSYRSRRLAERLEDDQFRAEYEKASAEIAQVDAVMRSLDSLRSELGVSKAALARAIGKDPASIRRLFSSEINPGLNTVAAMAEALGARVEVKRDGRKKAPVVRERELAGRAA